MYKVFLYNVFKDFKEWCVWNLLGVGCMCLFTYFVIAFSVSDMLTLMLISGFGLEVSGK